MPAAPTARERISYLEQRVRELRQTVQTLMAENANIVNERNDALYKAWQRENHWYNVAKTLADLAGTDLNDIVRSLNGLVGTLSRMTEAVTTLNQTRDAPDLNAPPEATLLFKRAPIGAFYQGFDVL